MTKKETIQIREYSTHLYVYFQSHIGKILLAHLENMLRQAAL